MTDDTESRSTEDTVQAIERISTGVRGLDDILQGGLIPERSYLVRGRPGTGKTILGLHYLTQSATQDDTSLFINLKETTADIEQNSMALGFDINDIDFLDSLF
ncbi:hypothetical protein BRC90_11320 [Halobacteriales archaeon QS_4_69_34]|nr:MAG: hypothetical protein BRC90_11320 [Halobacteriales archaeon QS_4_69_34]